MSQRPESPEFIHNILDSLRLKEPTYLGGDDVADAISAKTMTAITGPTGAGKSTVSKEVVALDDEFKEVHTSTTRAWRLGDPEGFRTGVTFGEFNDAVSNADLVNFNVIGQNVYGTYPEGFTATHNIGPIMAKSITQMRTYDWRRFDVAFMVTGDNEYDERLRTERVQFPDFNIRAIESLASLEFAEANIHEPWLRVIENSKETDVAKAARKVISLARGHTFEMMSDTYALQRIRGMSEALKRVLRDVH